ncbi:LLM class flavin-dependent oxidoreductase [Aeromicrobium sp. IC_218]|uniref:LLM class flavin-dependent oxidoreductase n=1 Tax=Aeromicrobium sp. IC_218 TaxID=2545468 RepID=UPI00103AD52A|nr:LLM class flavin-dependent oxidoreductase [Aeromicrobium sp. IC_218]TCJ00780.1 LLM class flavin-dependent oxidoreductase [Aeromicrobium sp. IC_218]
MPKPFHLNAFLMGVGHHEAAWRHPRTNAADVLDVRHFQRLAQVAERGRLDSIFFADGLAVGPRVAHNVQQVFEPITLLSAISAVTDRIGLIATASTSYNDPYTLARKFASLDHLSAGRGGWNIVTSAGAAEAANYGLDGTPEHAKRYARADEFVEVVERLWESWDADAVVLDEEGGWFTRPDSVHEVAHEGEHFRVAGPLNVPRSPQGRPLLVQAGSSEAGKEFAARYAEAVFTAQRTIEEGRDFYRDLKARLAAHGRSADELKVLPGIVPFIAATEAEARELEEEFTRLISPAYALSQLSQMLGVELSEADLDGPLPALPDVSSIETNKSRFELVKALGADGRTTVREVVAKLGGGRGHRTFAGTPEQVADDLVAWVEGGAADGFNVMAPYLPGGLEVFVDEVVPILQERGYFRTEYEATTLRGHYGLLEPAEQDERAVVA